VKLIQSIIAGGFIVTTLSVTLAYAQIPVTDTVAIEKSAAQHLAEIAKWADQLKAMERQFNQMKAQYDAITGSRGMGQLMNNPTRQVLPQDFTQSYDKLMTLGQGGASQDARKIYNVIKKLDCSRYQDPNAKLSCEAQAYAEPENAAYINGALAASQARAQQLKQLLSQVDSTTDLKASTDLANRIAAEQAMLQNEQILVNLALAQRQSQSMLLIQAREAEGRRAILENKGSPFGSLK
jgi:type IV secretion system protein VirB5